jgi:predicted  nucleic acid-binding Zn-ribbon protein
MKTLLAAATLLLALQPALAQNKKVFRCEDDRGRVTYSDEACKGGKELANTDERSAEQRKAAADVAQREEKLADKLTRERVAAEKAARPAGAARIPHSSAEEAAKAQPTAKSPVKKKKTVVAQKTQG